MPLKEPMDRDRLRWLVQRRKLAQRLIHDIYTLLNDDDLRRKIEADRAASSIFGYFVGIVFCLWRAVFLVDAKRDSWPAILNAARGFLSRVVERNAIGFDAELDERIWTVGFYVNSARLRLYRVEQKYPALSGAPAFADLSQHRDMGVDNSNVQLHWDIMYSAQCEALSLFCRERNLFSEGMFLQPQHAYPWVPNLGTWSSAT
jgi:hypothetical protein